MHSPVPKGAVKTATGDQFTGFFFALLTFRDRECDRVIVITTARYRLYAQSTMNPSLGAGGSKGRQPTLAEAGRLE